MIWSAGAVTVAAVLTAGWPLVAAAHATDPPRRSATIAASAVVITTVTGVAVNDLIGLPTALRALWALGTAGAACWLAVQARGLTTAGGFATRTGATRSGTARTWAARSGKAEKSDGGPGPDPDGDSDGDTLCAQDDVVQALVVASYALQMGDSHRASDAVDGALQRSRAVLDALLRERQRGDFVRREPVRSYRTVADASAGRH
ncbi:MFS transporter [Frankia sp. CiP1_Cm_nod2]|uniref:MFS transporter n=1 Tax=Frankia sp. CiP1_Cm_nod2 TaxID=2897161 RepID=UPI002023F92B